MGDGMRDEQRHPWIRGGVRLARGLRERVDAEALAGYARGEESCGALRGPADDALFVDEIVVMENRAAKLHARDPEAYPRTARTYFDVDPLRFSRLVESGEKEGRPVKVLYHSHLDAGAYFSETDAQAATMGGAEPAFDVAYLVTSVRDGVVDGRALFVWDPAARAFVEAPLRAEGEP